MRASAGVVTLWVLASCIGTSAGGTGTAGSGGDPTDAAARFVGAWTLEDWRSTDEQGNTRFPYGENAVGQIVYTASGRMGADLMTPPADSTEAPSRFLAYWGSYDVDEAAGTVTHRVEGASRAGWIGTVQVRRFRFEGADRLILSVGQNRLTWRRVS